MNQIPNVEDTNTREGIEEVIEQKSLSARDCLPDEEVINASQAVEIFHQELQKAREESLRKIIEVRNDPAKSTKDLIDLIDKYHSEIDQDKK